MSTACEQKPCHCEAKNLSTFLNSLLKQFYQIIFSASKGCTNSAISGCTFRCDEKPTSKP